MCSLRSSLQSPLSCFRRRHTGTHASANTHTLQRSAQHRSDSNHVFALRPNSKQKEIGNGLLRFTVSRLLSFPLPPLSLTLSVWRSVCRQGRHSSVCAYLIGRRQRSCSCVCPSLFSAVVLASVFEVPSAGAGAAALLRYQCAAALGLSYYYSASFGHLFSSPPPSSPSPCCAIREYHHHHHHLSRPRCVVRPRLLV